MMITSMMIIITSRHCDSHQKIIAITFSCRRVRHSKLGAWHKKVVELVCLIVLMIITISIMIMILIKFMIKSMIMMVMVVMMKMKMRMTMMMTILPPLYQTQDKAACICPAN